MPYIDQYPCVDPNDPEREMYYDASGHIRRRARRPGTLTQEEIRENNRQEEAAWARTQQAGLVNDYTRYQGDNLRAVLRRAPDYVRSWPGAEGLNAAVREANAALSQLDGTMHRAMTDESRALVRGNLASQAQELRTLMEGWAAQLRELYAGNRYAQIMPDGTWAVTGCHHCGQAGDSVHELTRCTTNRGTYWLCANCNTQHECVGCHTTGNLYEVQERAIEERPRRTGGVTVTSSRQVRYMRLCDECYAIRNRGCDRCRERGVGPLSAAGNDGGMYCADCLQYANLPHAVIHHHGWAPSTTKWCKLKHEASGGRNSTALYFGMEIETENVKGTLTNEEGAGIAVSSGLFYVENDGSISDGFEMVSHPFTWAWLQANSDKLDVLQELASKGFRGFKTETCGMHVHMSKNGMSRGQVYKLLRLIYGHPEFIELVSRRNKGQLDQWANPNLEYRPRDLTKYAKEKFLDGKYRALNLSKRSTAEVRIFRSTLSKTGVLMNLEFCKAALDYTKACSVKEANDTRAFVEHVVSSPDAYRFLNEFFAKERQSVQLMKLGLIDSMLEPPKWTVATAKYTPPEQPSER